MSELKRTSIGNAIENFVLNAVSNLPTDSIDICKLGFQFIKDKKEEKFITDVLNSKVNIDTSALSTQKSIERLYKVTQVIAKATTQEKINRFKKLTINGILFQNEISDNDYELYLNILDNLTDNEFLILSIINKIYPTILINNHPDPYCGYKGKITLSNLDDIIAKYKNDTQISMTEDNLFEILKEATGIQEEMNSYMLILYSKGLIELLPTTDGTMQLKKISNLGRKFVEFINK